MTQLHFFDNVHGEIERGVDPEVLHDIDPQISPDIESQLDIPESDEERAERLIAAAEHDEVNANARRNYLTRLVKEVGHQRKLDGFTINHSREPFARGRVEEKSVELQEQANETLGRACGVCALSQTCSIKGDLSAWTATHPFARSDQKATYSHITHPKIKQAESRMNFLKRLVKDPLADCVPPVEKSSQQSRTRKAA